MFKEKIQIKIGDVKIGGGAPISIQSMTNTKTEDVKGTLYQIEELKDLGCDIIRIAILNSEAVGALKEIKKKSPLPIVSDIHFDYRLALGAINAGTDALRLNPGNIGGVEHVKRVVELAKKQNIPIRIGVNGGSLEKDLEENKEMTISDKMVESAMRHIKILEDLDFNLIKVSLKSSDVKTTVEAYRKIYDLIPYPLHVGITEAGTLRGSRNITLSTKVPIVKAMVFPVVMYGCESWTIKKAECQRIDTFKLWCWRRPVHESYVISA